MKTISGKKTPGTSVEKRATTRGERITRKRERIRKAKEEQEKQRQVFLAW